MAAEGVAGLWRRGVLANIARSSAAPLSATSRPETTRAAGLLAPHTRFVNLTINGMSKGLYLLIEAVDRCCRGAV